MTRIAVWDLFVRIFHWALVLAFGANALVIDDDSKQHRGIGYTVLALVPSRIAWGFAGGGYARFASFPPSLSGARDQLTDIATGRTRRHIGHTPLGALMIYNLLASMLVVGVSGFLMTTDKFRGTDWTEALHGAAVTWTEISVLLHVFAVIYESLRTGVNLPAAMVRGYKEMPPGWSAPRWHTSTDPRARWPAGLVALMALLAGCVAFFVTDVAGDLRAWLRVGGGSFHLGIEAFATLALVAAIALEARMLLDLLRRKAHLERNLAQASAAVHAVILAHFAECDLSPAETDVARFHVKGLPIADIARMRGCAEGTVKAHLNAIHRKSGTTSRGDLLSVLIESLMGGRPPPP